MNVLSLFDGISCGQIALNRLGIKYDNYYASEIDKHAVKVTLTNYPNTIQLGDVTKIKSETLPKISLLLGGSPCQSFSIAGKGEGFDGASKLFWEYVRIKNETQPTYFLFENVKMKKRWEDVISDALGVTPVYINSSNFTGMIRKRYYWTNIPISSYEQKNIKIKELIDMSIPFDKPISFFLDRTEYSPTTSYDGIITINPRDNNKKQTWQRGRVYDIEGACPTICASLFDLNITQNHKTYRKLTINECEKLQGVPKDYTSAVTHVERGKCLGNGWTVDVICHILKRIN